MTAIKTLESPLVVGRDAILAAINRQIDEAKAGRGSLLLFAGEAGIGKTRLIRAALRQAVASGFRAGKGDLAPQDMLVSLASIADMARWMPRETFGDLGPDLLAMKGGKGGDSLASRRILVHEITDRIVAAIDTPTALAFEDLQWADELTLEVIGELARAAGDLPLVLFASYRLDELPTGSIHREWRSRLLTQRFAEEIQVGRLSHDDTALVTTLIVGNGLPAPRDVVDAVHARTNGIPLHIEELLAALGDRAVDGRAIRDAAVPDTIEDAILTRTARLSEDARAVARAGAILGRSFVPDVVAGILDRRVDDLDAPLDELVAAGILLPFAYIDEGYFDFRHQLLRDALYRNVPAAERRKLHARAAEFGNSLVGASEIHASVHYERAGLRADAFKAAIVGAKAAGALVSRFEEFELYRRAIANIPDGLGASELGDLYRAYGNAAFSVDDVPAIEDGMTRARAYYLEAGRPVDAAAALISLSGHARRDVRPRSERIALLDQAEAELNAAPPSSDRSANLADVAFMRAILEIDRVRLPETRARLEECIAFSEEAGVSGTLMEITRLDVDHMLAWADALDGDVQGGMARMIECSREARDRTWESTGVTGYRVAADVAIRFMEYPASVIGLTEGLRYADEIQQSYCAHVLAATSSHLAWVEGRWDDANTTAELELVQRGSRRSTLGSRAVLGFIAFGRGDVDRARQLFDEALAIARPSGEIDLVLPSLWGLAETALIAGDPARAFDHCQEALELTAPTAERALLVPFVVTGVRAALGARRPEAADRWLERMRALLVNWRDLAAPALAHAEGLIRLAAGSSVSARASLEDAVTGWDAKGRIWERAWARLDLAGCLLRANRYAEALVALEQVREIATSISSEPLLERATEIGRLARSRGGEVEAWHPLSAREFEVAQKIADGLTNGQIGDELFVSPKTISAHVEHILGKLGVARRAEIAVWVASVRVAPAAPTDAARAVAPAVN